MLTIFKYDLYIYIYIFLEVFRLEGSTVYFVISLPPFSSIALVIISRMSLYLRITWLCKLPHAPSMWPKDLAALRHSKGTSCFARLRSTLCPKVFVLCRIALINQTGIKNDLSKSHSFPNVSFLNHRQACEAQSLQILPFISEACPFESIPVDAVAIPPVDAKKPRQFNPHSIQTLNI